MASFEGRSLESSDLNAFMAAQTDWDNRKWLSGRWDAGALERAAAFYSPQIAAARADAAIANAALQSQIQRENPRLDFSVQHSRDPLFSESPWSVGFALDVLVEFADKRGLRKQIALQDVQAIQLHEAQVAWDVKERVDRAHLALFLSTSRLAIVQRQVEAGKHIQEMMQSRLALGEITRVELEGQQAEQARARIALIAAQKAQEHRRHELAAAIGLPVAALDRAALDFSDLEAISTDLPAAETLRHELVLNRLDVRGALIDYDLSELHLQLEVAKQYPDVHLGPGYLFDQSQHKLTFGLAGMALPVLQHNEGPIAEAKAHRAAVQARVEAVQAEALGTLEVAERLAQAAAHQLPDAIAAEAALSHRLAASESAFARGEEDRLDVELMHLEVATVQLERLEASAQLAQARLDLESAIQRPLP
jgi:outer membrane protein TolC